MTSDNVAVLMQGELQLHKGVIKGYGSYLASMVTDEKCGHNLIHFTLKRIGKRSGSIKLYLPLQALRSTSKVNSAAAHESSPLLPLRISATKESSRNFEVHSG